jgi:2-polyprenyl-3-methyl-5-hydroxy-6-metoxy-1,4-benzoquinol methylase
VNHNDYIFSITADGVKFLRRFEEMYRNCADPHGQSTELQRTDYQIVLQIVARALQTRSEIKRPRILDVGCGLGYFTARVSECFPDAHVSGCDISATAVEKATRAVPKSTFFTADLKQHRSLPAQTYDVALALHVLQYFTNEEIGVVVDNLNRLLNPGGFVLAAHHLPKEMSFGRFITTLDEAKTLFEAHGFAMRLGLDMTNDLDLTYAGEPVGRNLYFLAERLATI